MDSLFAVPTPESETTADVTPLDVSVVLPIYNERGHLRTEIDRIRAALDASPYTYEIVVVDDGSNDGSEHDLPGIEGIRLIRHSFNRGSGAARRTGTTAARGRVVVWTDVDMTYPNDRIPELVGELGAASRPVLANSLKEPEALVRKLFRNVKKQSHLVTQRVAGVVCVVL